MVHRAVEHGIDGEEEHKVGRATSPKKARGGRKGAFFPVIVRAWDASKQTQPEDMRPLWNFKGYMNNAWHRVKIHVS